MIDLEGILNLQYAYNYAPHLHTVRTFTAQFIEVWQHAVALKKEILLLLDKPVQAEGRKQVPALTAR